MYINVIGLPGSGKSNFIKKNLLLEYKEKFKPDIYFNYYLENKVFEHTGHNEKINSFLAKKNEEEVITIIIDTNFLLCIFRILKDFIFKRRLFLERLKGCIYCFLRKDKIMKKGLVVRLKNHIGGQQ